MASDYMGYYEEGVTPPEGSKTWIAPFTQDAFDKVIKPNEDFINLFATWYLTNQKHSKNIGETEDKRLQLYEIIICLPVWRTFHFIGKRT